MYGEGRNWRYLIGLGLLIVLIFIVIVLIVRGGGKKAGKVPETSQALISYVNDPDATVTETIVGPITAAQNHNELTISVSNQTASFQLSQGYDGNVIRSQDYPMNTDSFGEFLHALDGVGYTKGNTDKALKNDAGYCPTGQRYIFEVKSGAASVQRFWATSCKGVKTYRGNLSQTIDLFQAQIPDYDNLTQNSNFGGSIFGL